MVNFWFMKIKNDIGKYAIIDDTKYIQNDFQNIPKSTKNS